MQEKKNLIVGVKAQCLPTLGSLKLLLEHTYVAQVFLAVMKLWLQDVYNVPCLFYLERLES